MTTHDEQATGTPTSAERSAPPPSDGPSSATSRTDALPRQDELGRQEPGRQEETSIEADELSMAPAEQPQPAAEQPQAADVPRTAEAEPSADELLFAGDNLTVLRSRWDDVQTAFVDDPTKCVQEADALVAEVVEQLTAGFSDARSRLESQWARGEDVSTEDLRLALRRYREFFERLLAV
jgi:hypothetical protein